MDLRVGYFVVPKSETDPLRSGSSAYGAGVVACLDPFLVVSRETDMCWSTKKPEDFRAIAVAEPEVVNAVQWRVPADKQIRVPCGESLLSNELGCGLTLFEVGEQTLAIDLNSTNKVWNCMGGWAKSIAEADNPSYGWVFRWDGQESQWRALMSTAPLERERLQGNTHQGIVLLRDHRPFYTLRN